VIAGSFSQTYLRNAFNNGLLCIEVPELVKALSSTFVEGQDKSVIPGDEIEVDFTSGKLTYRGTAYVFPAMGSVPQGLVIAGGVENLVAKRLGLK